MIYFVLAPIVIGAGQRDHQESFGRETEFHDSAIRGIQGKHCKCVTHYSNGQSD